MSFSIKAVNVPECVLVSGCCSPMYSSSERGMKKHKQPIVCCSSSSMLEGGESRATRAVLIGLLLLLSLFSHRVGEGKGFLSENTAERNQENDFTGKQKILEYITEHRGLYFHDYFGLATP